MEFFSVMPEVQGEHAITTVGNNQTLPTQQSAPVVGSGLMRMVWHELLFMHWKADPDQLRQHIPAGLELDMYNGKAWIGIVPFRMSGVSLRWLPDIPWMSKFPELNVRTYVIGPDGQSGVWFYSLDATNLIAVRGARWLYNLNYMDARIRFQRDKGCNCGSWIRYESRRTHANEAPAELNVEYRPIGESLTADQGTLLDWLTRRYSLFSRDRKGQLYRGDIAHEPWKLREAQAIVRQNTMTSGIGVDLPDDKPLLHYAHCTRVLAGAIRPVK